MVGDQTWGSISRRLMAGGLPGAGARRRGAIGPRASPPTGDPGGAPRREVTRRHLLTRAPALTAVPGPGGAALAAARPSGSQADVAPRRSPHAARRQGVETGHLEALVRQSMGDAAVPGVAIGVIFGDWLYTHGFGVTDVDYPLPVDGQ